MKQAVFGIVGWKNHGKTTMVSRLIAEFTQRGYHIASIKHAHHDFDIDHIGTDSWRHRKAGAQQVLVASSKRWALMSEITAVEEITLSQLLEQLAPCDLVLIEGYKGEAHDKLELRRQGGNYGPPLSETDPHIVAIASDIPQLSSSLPLFDLNDIVAISNFIETHMNLRFLNNHITPCQETLPRKIIS